MTNRIKQLLWFNWGVWAYLTLLVVLNFNGWIGFGLGLGDLAYIVPLWATVVLHFLVIMFLKQSEDELADPARVARLTASGAFFLLVALFYTWKGHLGQG
jgi:hypothetical protein